MVLQRTDCRDVMETNFMGTVNFCTLFLPDMKKRNKGHIVNVGSIAGHQAYPMGSIYNASKFALKGYI